MDGGKEGGMHEWINGSIMDGEREGLMDGQVNGWREGGMDTSLHVLEQKTRTNSDQFF